MASGNLWRVLAILPIIAGIMLTSPRVSAANATASSGTWECAATADVIAACPNLIPPMPTPRFGAPAATDPATGLIYTFGGQRPSRGDTATTNVVEAYNPATRTWLCSVGDTGSGCTAENSVLAPVPENTWVYGETATAGKNGLIYVLGGCPGSTCGSSGFGVGIIAAYNPVTNSWTCEEGASGDGCTTQNSTIAPLTNASYAQMAAATGPDGMIYVLQGLSLNSYEPLRAYNPATNTWTTLAPIPVLFLIRMTMAAYGGKIYALGPAQYHLSDTKAFMGLEIYDPKTDTWTAGKPAPQIRDDPSLIPAPDGKLYLVGGWAYNVSQQSNGMANCFAYDPATDSWSQIPSMALVQDMEGVALGPDGNIYVLGGEIMPEQGPVSPITGQVEEFSIAKHQWNAVSVPSGPQHSTYGPASLPLAVSDGSIYVLSEQADPWLGSYQTGHYLPTTNDWSVVALRPVMQRRPQEPMAATVGPDGKLYVFGMINQATMAADLVEVYDPGADSWNCAANTTCTNKVMPLLPTARSAPAAITGNGLIYVFGGDTSTTSAITPTGVVEAYDPAGGWRCSTGDTATGCPTADSSLAPMPTPREDMAAALGQDGLIYLLGGRAASGDTNVVEAYDPAHNTWLCSVGDTGTGCTAANSVLPALPTAREGMASAVTSDGTIYTFGGMNTASPQGTTLVEAYQPSIRAWTCSRGDAGNGCTPNNSTLAPMPFPAALFGAATLTDGRIMLVGGTASVYDSLSIFTPPGPSAALISHFTASRDGHGLTFRWRVASPAGIAGFNLYAGGRRLNAAMIPAHPGRDYRFRLNGNAAGPFRLEVVRDDGSRYSVHAIRSHP